MKNEYILFDNDGVLVDTEKYYFKASKEVLATVGLNLSIEKFCEISLIKGVGVWEAFPDELSDTELVDRLRTKRDRIYNNYLKSEYIAIDGVEDVLRELSSKFRMAIVTSALRDDFLTIHNRTGLLKYFDFYLTNGDYPRSKPDPSPYLKAVERFGCPKESSIIIEDTLRGVMAGKNAEIDTVAIKSELSASIDFSDIATYTVNSIGELPELLI